MKVLSNHYNSFWWEVKWWGIEIILIYEITKINFSFKPNNLSYYLLLNKLLYGLKSVPDSRKEQKIQADKIWPHLEYELPVRFWVKDGQLTTNHNIHKAAYVSKFRMQSCFQTEWTLRGPRFQCSEDGATPLRKIFMRLPLMPKKKALLSEFGIWKIPGWERAWCVSSAQGKSVTIHKSMEKLCVPLFTEAIQQPRYRTILSDCKRADG